MRPAQKKEGERGRVGGRGFTMVELMIVVGVTGLLAALAVPSYVKYLRRSRTVEATMNLRRIFDASEAYYQSEHARIDGGIVARQFPLSNPTTPATPQLCCAAGKCNPSTYAASWNSQTWSALNFSVDDPFLYAYQYDAAGTDSSANFTVTAFGDLDCNGSFSLFQRVGFVGPAGEVTGGAALYLLNEIE
jgi:prepilin-type N-terminal cleavage/methylation domain-containing protein